MIENIERRSRNHIEGLFIDSLMTHAQFGRLFCCYLPKSPLEHIDLGVITSEYYSAFLIGTPLLDLDAMNDGCKVTERDSRDYLRSERIHLIRKLQKALIRNDQAAAAAHANR